MKNSIKLLSLFLALVMLFSIALPMTASADTVIQNLNFNCRIYENNDMNFDVPAGSHTQLYNAEWRCSNGKNYFNDSTYPNINYNYELYFTIKAENGYSFSESITKASFNNVPLVYNQATYPTGSFRVTAPDTLQVKVTYNYLAFKDENGIDVSPYASGLAGFYIAGEVIPFSDIDAQFENGHFDHFTVDGNAVLYSTSRVLNNQVTMGTQPSTVIAHYVNHDVYREVIKKSTFSEYGEFVYKCHDCAFTDWRDSRDLEWVDYEMEGFDDGVADSKVLYYNGKTQHLGLMLSFEGRALRADEYNIEYPAESKKVGRYTAKASIFSEYFDDEMTYTYNIYFGKPKVKATVSNNAVKLTWKKVTGASGYRVYSYNFKTGSYKKIKDTKSLSFKQSVKNGGKKYGYLVRAYGINKDGKTEFSPYKRSDVVSVITLCNAPKAKASVSGKTVTLKWAKVSGAKYYRVYKYNSKTKKYKTVVKSTKKVAVKLSKQPKGKNYYLVRAFNSANKGSQYSGKNLVKAQVKK